METAYSQYTAQEDIIYMEENANIRPATDPAESACKPSHHSFLSFPYNYYNSFSFFSFHPSLCRLNSHCKATNQWFITVKCLSPSSLNSNGANCSGKLTHSSQWCKKKTSLCTNPTSPLLMVVRSVGAHGCMMPSTRGRKLLRVFTSPNVSKPCTLLLVTRTKHCI